MGFVDKLYDAGFDQIETTADRACPDVTIAILAEALDPVIRAGDALYRIVLEAEKKTAIAMAIAAKVAK